MKMQQHNSIIYIFKLLALMLAVLLMCATAAPAFALPAAESEIGKEPIMVSLGDSYSSGEGIFTVVFAATAVFSVGLVTRLLFPSLLILQTPEIFCFTVMAFWEAAIQSGIIISNTGYGDVFRNSGFNAVIYDSKGRAVYSAGGAELPEKDRIVHPVFIRGGCLVYNEDISELNRVNEALEETSDSLEEEQAALIASNRLREEEEQIKAKNLI